LGPFFFLHSIADWKFQFHGSKFIFSYVQGYFGVTSQDATWLLRGFQSGTIITGIAGLVFINGWVTEIYLLAQHYCYWLQQ
jgi:hypothetical protein